MDLERGRQLLAAERARVKPLLALSGAARRQDSTTEREAGDGDGDTAQPLAQEEVEIAIESRLRERLSDLTWAEERVADGTYGKSIRSGLPIPDERLEIDPAAELTVSEAARLWHSDR